MNFGATVAIVQMKSDPVTPNSAVTRPEKPTSPLPSPVSAELLFRGAKEIVIRHQGDDYRLRITRNDKLILTK